MTWRALCVWPWNKGGGEAAADAAGGGEGEVAPGRADTGIYFQPICKPVPETTRAILLDTSQTLKLNW